MHYMRYFLSLVSDCCNNKPDLYWTFLNNEQINVLYKRQILKEDKERTCKLHTARPEARTTNSPASERPQPAGGLETKNLLAAS